MLSHIQLFCNSMTVAHQVPLPMHFFRQEYWNELPFPFPRDFPDLGSKPMSLALASRLFTTDPPDNPALPLINCMTWVSHSCSLGLCKMKITIMPTSQGCHKD